ncbi:hypothetical protein [Pseudonocardia humida]|uniref:Uncharacterized protein n=1 Tax=Pseudonocardia humida TaxID=2800819 RepID=A0ABT1A7J6_9PSEU|nr:hypothetical protein [Pseudonocardia humida]MCO1658992.1 hypothetical protein [Pseudonocardia humida]
MTEAVALTACTARLQTCFPEARVLRDPDVAADRHLLTRTPQVSRAVTEANAAGYSGGAGDLLRDLWPPL